jgi:hypothetical protein
MAHGPEDLAFGATAGCILFATGVAFMLTIYAMLTFVALLSTPPAQQLVGMTY